MIDEKILLEQITAFKRSQKSTNCDYLTWYISALSAVEGMIAEQPKVGEWIPCSKGLPEEHDSMFKKFKGTNKWNNAMFETISDNVNVTIEFENGKRATVTSYTTDGEWRCEKEYGLNTKAIAWMPLPEPYKGVD